MSAPKRVVVIGGGIVGLSVAYHLTRTEGMAVTVLERDRLMHGSTRFGSGGIRTQFDNRAETLLSLRSQAIWSDLERRHDIELGLRRVGYLSLATDESSAQELERRVSFQRELDLDVRTVPVDELERLVPQMSFDDVQLARLTPSDGYAVPRRVARTLAGLALAGGVAIHEHAPVRAIVCKQDRVAAVLTGSESFACEAVVNAGGIWAPAIGEMVGAHFPIHPHYHHQFVTKPLPWLGSTPPCLAEMDGSLYLRPDGEGVLFGLSHAGEARAHDDIDPEILAALRSKLEQRWPPAAAAEIERAWVGPEEISVDGRPFIGELASPRGYVYANGFSGHGFMLSLAVGEVVAEIVAEADARSSDVESFALERVQPASVAQ